MSEAETVYAVGEADRGKRLDLFLKERIPSVSRSYLQRAIRSRVRLSWGAEARPSAPVLPGGVVLVGFPAVDEVLLDLPLPVLARGEGWLAVDKPAGVPVHPTNRVRENTLLRMLCRQEGREGLRPVHRLDRETSGVLLVAEDAAGARALSIEFAEGRVRKEYLAVAAGVLGPDEGTVDLPIVDARGSGVRVRREPGAEGPPAVTLWKVVRRLADRTLVRLLPLTGRRHQLRVHLASLGHPILGDLLYGRPEGDYLDYVRGLRDVRGQEGGPGRHLLHCSRLVFRAPDRAEQEVRSTLPADFQESLA